MPSNELDLPEEEIIELLKPLYGMAEPEDHCWRKTMEIFLNNLRMIRENGDLCFFYMNDKTN